MWDVPACRCCLSTIDRLERFTDKTIRLFVTVTGLEINLRDGYPMYLCIECNVQFKKAIAFRRKCRRGFYALQQIMQAKKEVTLPSIFKVNRKQANLASSIGFLDNKSNMSYYNMVEVETLEKDVKEEQVNNNEPATEITEKNSDYGLIRMTPEQIAGVRILEFQSQTVPETEYSHYLQDDDYGSSPDDGIEHTDETGEPQGTDELPEEIDLDDVFKGLDDEQIDDDDQWPIEEEIDDASVHVDEKQNENKKELRSESIRSYSKALEGFTITVIPPEERQKIFDDRMNIIKRFSRFFCSVCVRKFACLEDLKRHIVVHQIRNKNSYICPICKDNFNEPKNLEIHMHENHYYRFKCNTCPRELFTLHDILPCYNSHGFENNCIEAVLLNEDEKRNAWIKFNEEEKGNKKFVCLICTMPFKTEDKLLHHNTNRHKVTKNSFQCNPCNQVFKTEHLLNRHLMDSHKYSFNCKCCPLIFYSPMAAKKHARLHPRSICDICQKVFKRAETLKRHLGEFHGGTKHTKHCPVCGESFFTLGKLYFHQLTEHGHIKISEFDELAIDKSCSECVITFDTPDAFTKHYSDIHEDNKAEVTNCIHCEEPMPHICKTLSNILTEKANYPMQCPYCGDTQEKVVDMADHLKNVHDETTVYNFVFVVCHTCGATVRSTYINQHIRLHKQPAKKAAVSGICTICPFVYRSEPVFIAHVLARHTPLPYVCALCPQRYTQRFVCKDHILKAHAPVKLFQCERCSRKFSHNSFLTQHIKKVHDPKFRAKPLKPKVGSCDDRIIVYPDMKIDVSVIDPDILERVPLVVHDYSDNVVEIINNWEPYTVVTEKPEIPLHRPSKKVDPERAKMSYLRKRERRKKRNESTATAVEEKRQKIDANVKIEKSEVVQAVEGILEERHTEEVDMKDDEQEIVENNCEEEEEFVTEEVDIKDDEQEIVENNCEEEEEVVTEEMLASQEVIEVDGEYYVAIEGVLYKIEQEND